MSEVLDRDLRKYLDKIIESNSERTKYILGELDRLERKIDRYNRDVWKYISDMSKHIIEKK